MEGNAYWRIIAKLRDKSKPLAVYGWPLANSVWTAQVLPRFNGGTEPFAGSLQPSFSIMISKMVRSVSVMPGALTRPMFRITCSGVVPQMPSAAWRTTPSIAR